jgi:THO complex subunit 1 transcription elongation factor
MITDDAPAAPAEQTVDPEKASTSAHRSLPTPADTKPAVISTLEINTPSAQPAGEQLPRIPAVESKELVCYFHVVFHSRTNVQTLLPQQEKQTYSWLALRAARNQYINAFSDRKIGMADVPSLIKEVKRIKEDEKKREDILTGKIVVDPGAPPPTGAASLSTPAPDTMKAPMTPEPDRILLQNQEEVDFKMEDGNANGKADAVIVEPVDSQNAALRMEVD